MAVTRSFLKGMGLTEEQVSAIIEEHVSTVNGLKADRDAFKTDADKLKDVQKELDALKAKGDGGWEQKYNDEHKAFEDFKTNLASQKTKAEKVEAYKALLKSAKVTDKAINLIVKANADEIEKLVLKDGKIESEEELKKSITEDYKEYIEKDSGGGKGTDKGAGGGSGFEAMSLEQKMSYANEHPDAPEVKSWLNS